MQEEVFIIQKNIFKQQPFSICFFKAAALTAELSSLLSAPLLSPSMYLSDTSFVPVQVKVDVY